MTLLAGISALQDKGKALQPEVASLQGVDESLQPIREALQQEKSHCIEMCVGVCAWFHTLKSCVT